MIIKYKYKKKSKVLDMVNNKGVKMKKAIHAQLE